MVISWWRTWWRSRRRAHRQPVWLRQRGLSLENLEDRRLLSAGLVLDSVLRALDAVRSPTAQVALISGTPATSVGLAVDAGSTTPGTVAFNPTGGTDVHAGAFPINTRGDRQFDFKGFSRGYYPVTISLNADWGNLRSSSLDATFAAGLNPIGDTSWGAGRGSSAANPRSELPSSEVSPGSLDGSLTLGSTSTPDGQSSTTAGDSQGQMIVPSGLGSGVTVSPVDLAPLPAAPLAPAEGVTLDLSLGQGSQGQNGADGLSGGGATVGVVDTDPPAEAPVSMTAADWLQGNLVAPVKLGASDSGADTTDQSSASTGALDGTGSTPDGGSAAQGDGQSPGDPNDGKGHSPANKGTDGGDAGATSDSSSADTGRHSGQHGGRGRGGNHQAADDDDPADSGPAMADAVADPTAEGATGLSTDASQGQTSGTAASSDSAVAFGSAAETSVIVTVTVTHHHHHRIGPVFLPTISAADLSYTAADLSYAATAWGQGPDIGPDGLEDYFPASYDFTTKIDGIPTFRPDGLAHGDKSPGQVEKADWRSLASQLRGTYGAPVLIGWGNSGSALTVGEGSGEGLDLVHNLQVAANRGAEVAGFHRMTARTSHSQDRSLEDQSLALTETAVFFAARPPRKDATGHASDRGFQQFAAAPSAEVGPGRIAHLVAGSFQAEHLNCDGGGPEISQRLDGRGWWGIVAQFVLAPQFPHNHQPTIMLAVADEPSRDALNIALVKANFMVLTAATAREAMKLLRTPLSPVDVALLDVHLPDVNGVDLCSRLRELYPKLPVLVCTDQAEQGDVSQLQKLNVLRVFSKPVAIGELLAAVRGIVS